MPGEVKKVEDVIFRPGSKAAHWWSTLNESVNLKEFSALSNETDQVLYCQSLANFDQLPLASDVKPKNHDEAMKLKDEGNKAYKEGKYYEAKYLYTMALATMPFDEKNLSNNVEYSIILANRSAALDAMRLYEACVQDIDLAFKYGYPRNLQFKIYNRKGHALLKLKQFVDSKAAFTKCLDMIGKSDMPSKQRDQFRMKTKKQMTVFNVVKKLLNQPLDSRPDVKLTQGSNDSWQGLSSMVTLQENPNKVVANEKVTTGNVLLKEDPLVAIAPNDDPKTFICPVTLQRADSAVPCSFGSWTFFSSEQAREKANNSFHKFEYQHVPSLKANGFSDTALLGLRLITSLHPDDLGRVLDSCNEAKERTTDLKRFQKAFELPLAKLSDSDAFCAAATAAVFLKCLHSASYKAEEQLLAKLLLKAVLLTLQFSLPMKTLVPPNDRQAIYKADGYTMRVQAYAMFPTCSKLTQVAKFSEDPDLFPLIVNGRLTLVAHRSIAVGKEIALNSKLCDTRSYDVINDMITFRCSNDDCTVGFPLKENTKEKLIKCPMESCGKETNIWLKLKRVQELKESYKKVKAKISEGQLSDGIIGLSFLIKEWERVIIRPYKDISQLEKDLRFAIALKQLEDEATWFRERS